MIGSFTPEIAIIDQNILTAVGMKCILEEIFPDILTRLFPSFESLITDTPDAYTHYFVSAQIYFEHTSFFKEKGNKCIVLSAGESKALEKITYLNTYQSEGRFIRDILDLHEKGHAKHNYDKRDMPQRKDPDSLTHREAEVLRLVVKGLTNKEIAEKLNIGLTTVISHRKNIVNKVGIKSASGLAIYAVLHGYIEADCV